MENFVLPRMPIYGIYVPHIHNPESARKIYGLDLKYARFVMTKTATDSKAKGKKPECTRSLLG